MIFFFFFFNDTATTEIYTLSLHDALPICVGAGRDFDFALSRSDRLDEDPLGSHRVEDPDGIERGQGEAAGVAPRRHRTDRKSTRLNSSHSQISYAVFCLKKKKNNKHIAHT